MARARLAMPRLQRPHVRRHEALRNLRLEEAGEIGMSIELVMCAFLAGVAVGCMASAVVVRRARAEVSKMRGRWLRATERHDHSKIVIARMVDEEAKGRRLPVVA